MLTVLGMHKIVSAVITSFKKSILKQMKLENTERKEAEEYVMDYITDCESRQRDVPPIPVLDQDRVACGQCQLERKALPEPKISRSNLLTRIIKFEQTRRTIQRKKPLNALDEEVISGMVQEILPEVTAEQCKLKVKLDKNVQTQRWNAYVLQTLYTECVNNNNNVAGSSSSNKPRASRKRTRE